MVMTPTAVTRDDAHLSYSSLNQFAQCARSWYSRRVLGKREQSGEAAAFGSTFDQVITYRLGLTRPNDAGEIVDPLAGANSEDPVVADLRSAADYYLSQYWSWKDAEAAQEPIRIEPSQWGTLADEYGAYGDIHLPLIGFIDLYRSRGIERSICDLKTSSKQGFQPGWALQTTLYALAKRARTCEIHLLVRLKRGFAFHAYRFHPDDATIRWAMSWVGAQAEGIRAAQAASSLERLPATPGWHCAWCPERSECVAEKFGSLAPLGGSSTEVAAEP